MNEELSNRFQETEFTDLITTQFPHLNQWDHLVTRKIYHKYEGSWVRKWALQMSFLGDPRLWAPALIIFGIYGIIKWDFSYLVIFTTGFLQSYAIYYIFKNTVKRKRPFDQLKDVVRLDKTGHGYSFPSGHAHHSAILVGLLWFCFFPNPWWLILLLIYNTLIAFSRIVSGCHYPSDTLFALVEAYLALGLYLAWTKDLYLAALAWGMQFLTV